MVKKIEHGTTFRSLSHMKAFRIEWTGIADLWTRGLDVMQNSPRGARGARDSRARVLVVIPAYNERESILSTVEQIQALGYDYVVVNDGSKDDTLDICHAHELNVLDLPQNLGIGGAVQAGHKYAQRFGYDVDVQVDGDGQHDPTCIPRLLEQIEEGADLAIGSRFLEETDGFQSTFMRRIGITWLSFWIKLFTGKHVTDPTSGFRASGQRAINLFCKNYPVDYPEPESIALALKMGLSVREVPVSMLERQGGKSSIGGFSSIYYMIKVSLAIWISCWTHSAKKRTDQ